MGSQWELLGLVNLYSLPFLIRRWLQTLDIILSSRGSSPFWLRGRGPFPPALSDSLPAALLGLPWQQHQSHSWLETGGQPYGITAQALPGLQSVAHEPNDSAVAQREGWWSLQFWMENMTVCIFIHRLLINNLSISPTSQWSKGWAELKIASLLSELPTLPYLLWVFNVFLCIFQNYKNCLPTESIT